MELLAGPGTEWGLIGPRERPRLWQRHLLNCAAVADLVPPDVRVVDVGSGAGLPGLVLAVRRPDLGVDLVEPLERRTRFLDLAVAELGLGERVRVVRGRADDAGVRRRVGGAPVCTARAVAPLGRLLDWCLPLLADDGQLLAMKGARAVEEIATVETDPSRRGRASLELIRLPSGEDEDVTVVVARKRESG